MFNKNTLVILTITAFVLSLVVIQQVSAEWQDPGYAPGSGDINPPLTNPLTEDLDLDGNDIVDVKDITGSGDVKGGRLCIGASCQSVWPSGDVKNPMDENLNAGEYIIWNLRSCKPEDGEQCYALSATANDNLKSSKSLSVGVYGTTSGKSNYPTYGVYGLSQDVSGVGVHGSAFKGLGWAGYFTGSLGVTGDSYFTGDVYVNFNSGAKTGGILNVEKTICLAGVCRGSWPAGGTLTGSGTTGRISKWTGTTSLGNSVIYENSNKIGIGTSGPSEKLQVVGNIKLGGTEGDIKDVSWITGYNDLFLKGDSTETSDVHLGGSNIRAWTNGSERLTILNNGNVGIGTTTPAYKLDVAGTFSANSVNINDAYTLPTSDGSASQVLKTNGNGAVSWQDDASGSGSLWTANGSNIYYNTGKVGIGTDSPNKKLHIYDVSQNAELDIQSTAAASSHWGIYHDASSDDLKFWKDSADRLTITDDGHVGIGVASPTEDLEVANNVSALAYYYSSDINLKKNVQTIQNPLEKIKSLRGVSFAWKENNETSLGFIAQEVEKVLPELVKKHNGLESVQYGNITAVLVEAVKEQQKQIEALQAEISKLKTK